VGAIARHSSWGVNCQGLKAGDSSLLPVTEAGNGAIPERDRPSESKRFTKRKIPKKLRWTAGVSKRTHEKRKKSQQSNSVYSRIKRSKKLKPVMAGPRERSTIKTGDAKGGGT